VSATPPIPVGTFDPAQVTVSFANKTIIGIAKGSAIKVSRNSPQYTHEVGANGDVVRVLNNDQTGAIELELMQSSPSNDALNTLAQLDAKSATGSGSVQVKDLNGRSMAHGDTAWVEKLPDAEYATEATNRTWKIVVSRLEHNVGGIV